MVAAFSRMGVGLVGAVVPEPHPGVGTPGSVLPRWPLTLAVAWFPLWWLLGLGSLIWILIAVPMLLLMFASRDVRAPRGFAIWLLFLVWMSFSFIALDNFGRFVGFAYRAALYFSLTVLFLYAYNLLRRTAPEYIYGLLTIFFAGVVAAGFLGLLAPTLTIRTPMAYLMPGFLMANDLVRDMVVIRTTQFNPDAWAYIDPRPSAPFLYTNNWGNAYSLLLPVVVTDWVLRRRPRVKFWLVGGLIGASLVPALLTLNRGMFLGLGLAAVVLAVRHAFRGNFRVLVLMAGAGVLGAATLSILPVEERLDNRLESSGTNYSRMTVYVETIEAVGRSPLFGYGAPRPTESTVVPLGTQGQVWMVLFSHGFVGLLLFLGFLGALVLLTLRRVDLMGMTLNAVLVVLFVQSFYYGLLFQGLLIGFLVAAAALRGPSPVDADEIQGLSSRLTRI